MRSLADILVQPITPPAWAIQPILEEGDRLLIYGEWGSFKSLYAGHLGLVLAAGMSVGPFSISKPRRVLYMDEEMNEQRSNRRLHRLVAGMGTLLGRGTSAYDLPFFMINKSGHRFDAKGLPQIRSLAEKAKLGPGDVLFYDSFRRGLIGSENDQQAVSEFWHAADQLKGLGLITPHHMHKPKTRIRETRHAASGNTDIMAGVDQALAIVRHELQVEVTHEKGREGEAAPFTVSFQFQGDSETGPIVVSYGAAAPARTNDDRIIGFLLSQPACRAETGAIASGSGVPLDSVKHRLPRLEKDGTVRKLEHGVWGLTEVESLSAGVRP